MQEFKSAKKKKKVDGWVGGFWEGRSGRQRRKKGGEEETR